MATKEYFPQIGKIKFEGKESKNPLAFRYYDPEKVINGKKMKDWLRFSMAHPLRRRWRPIRRRNKKVPVERRCNSAGTCQKQNGRRF